ncbi:MAG: O-methyltransferase [Saprospiraceae bacterium]
MSFGETTKAALLCRMNFIEMNQFFRALTDYCEAHSTGVDEVLYELERETHLKTLSPQMISGRFQGRFLQMLSKLIHPKEILEIGTFTGYASICLARGLADGGRLTTIEVNPEIRWISEKYFKKAELEEKIVSILGDAREVISTLTQELDLVFIDAAKPDNAWYYETILPKVRKGGVILIDNTLWSGKVVMEAHDNDTALIKKFNTLVSEDGRTENIILPLRDGLTIVRKL